MARRTVTDAAPGPRTTRRAVLGAALAAPLAAPARAQGRLRWRMATSWPRRLPGPGMSAERVAQRIGELSGGRLTVEVNAAGELVPAFEVLDAVGGGTCEMGHTASLFWQGKMPAAAFFCTVPFGLLPAEHVAWIDVAGGQTLWDRLYAPFGVKPFMAGNSGVSMAGWYRRELKTLDDVKGLKLRMVGLGAEIFRRLGSTPVSIAPGEIVPALTTGVVDGAEFLGPGSDIALALWRVAPVYHGPGFTKPNGTGEALVALKAWEALDASLKAAVAHACAAEAAYALAETERMNAEALKALTETHKVTVAPVPPAIVAAARPHAQDVVAALAGTGGLAREIVESYAAFQARVSPWTRLGVGGVLAMR